jgi:SAM-dependent methyltransferase
MNTPKSLLQQVAVHARADGKEAYFRLHQHRYAAILAALGDAPAGARVLEVGVTPGQCTRLLVLAGYHVCGVDLDPTPRKALWEQLGVPVCQMNLERDNIPYADGTFDRVVFSEVIEHLVYSPLPVLREFWRVLAPGGKLIITTPNELYLKSRIRALAHMLLWRSLDTPAEFRHKMLLEGDARYTTHTRIYTMQELCWLVEQVGFHVGRRQYSAAWERVGLERGRLRHNPAGVLAKAILTSITTMLPATRSMLVVTATKPTT